MTAPRRLLRLLERAHDRHGLSWEVIASEASREVKVTERTLYNALAWYRAAGKYGTHQPDRKTLRAIGLWLRSRGVRVAVP